MAKFVEGACYLLYDTPDEGLRREVDHLVNLIESAQQPDGYLNIHFVVCEPDKRWSNLRDLHELYNAGHLIEAAVAHHSLTGSKQFVNVMLRFVRYASTVFGTEPNQKRGYPGHPEIELALLRLYHATGDAQSLQLAAFFLHERGQNNGQYYTEEQEARGEHPYLAPAMVPKRHSYWYMQAHKPIAEQETIEGHSVRAMYLLTAVADLCIAGRSGATKAFAATAGLQAAVERLWKDCCTTKTAVTGGIGTVHQWEGFSIPYSLPSAIDEGGSYNETCASIGQLMLADRLQELDGVDGAHVADVAERALYNASITTGMSLDGAAFTYDNALASAPGAPCQRHTWFECACCPPNVLRTLAAIGGYFWSPLANGGLAVHHFFDGAIRTEDGQNEVVRMKTEFPWDGRVEINVTSAVQGPVLVRIPAWAAQKATLASQGTAVSLQTERGYTSLRPGHHVLDMHLAPRLIYSHPYTNQDTLTVAYGPLIYCLEDLDNPFESNHFKDLTLCAETLRLEARKSKEHGGIVVIEAKGAGRQLELASSSPTFTELSHDVPLKEEKLDLLFVPYYFRANRKGGRGQMRTSLRRRRVP